MVDAFGFLACFVFTGCCLIASFLPVRNICRCRMNVLAKVDMTADTDSGLIATIKLPEGNIGGEFVVVPKHAPSTAALRDEDDAWLIGFCRHHQTLDSSCMVHPAICQQTP